MGGICGCLLWNFVFCCGDVGNGGVDYLMVEYCDGVFLDVFLGKGILFVLL